VSAEDASAGRRAGLTFLRADMHDLPLPDASFDLVWMRHCLEHAFAPALALMEAARMTRPEGLVYVGTPRQDEHEWILAEPHYVVPTELQMENWRAKAGLHLVSYELADEQRWLLRRGE
jgi:ubiquinone/menaquinone biosynthesis C-methylase UbiE